MSATSAALSSPLLCKRVIAVLGGSTFAPAGGDATAASRLRALRAALASLAPLLRREVDLVISHGNGPQVGHMQAPDEQPGRAELVPLGVCAAERAGELGYLLAQSLHNLLLDLGIQRPIAALLTQVEVDGADPALLSPTRAVGPFYGAEAAQRLRARGFTVRHESGRGFRRVVPAPAPVAVVDVEVLRRLLGLGALVIAGGGGGIPVIRRHGRLEGIDAVIDEDLSAALLGEALDADLLLILTDVPGAFTDWRSASQEPLGQVSASTARDLLARGHFPPGSMGPKVSAAARFASQPGRSALICDPASLAAALEGRAGTLVVPDRPA